MDHLHQVHHSHVKDLSIVHSVRSLLLCLPYLEDGCLGSKTTLAFRQSLAMDPASRSMQVLSPFLAIIGAWHLTVIHDFLNHAKIESFGRSYHHLTPVSVN